MPIEIKMPRLSDTMQSGTIVKWNVAAGDKVASGAVLADVETDKATMELSTFDDGVVAQIVVPEGKQVEVGTIIALLALPGEDASAITLGKSGAGSAATGPVRGTASSPPPLAAQDSSVVAPVVSGEVVERDGASGERLRISPVARRLAEEAGVDPSRIRGSGPGGRIIKRDVLALAESTKETRAAVPPAALARRDGAAVPSLAAPVVLGGAMTSERMPVSGMRQTIARRLVESKQAIPHYQVSMAFAMDALLELRASLNAQLASSGVKLSVNDFLVRACALAMEKNREFNASWDGDAILYHRAVNIGMAISLPPERGGGLVVGVVRDADRKSLRQISAESKALAEKARTKGLTIEEMSDSTFTLSNLGMFGVEHFTAIINPPNSAILAVGAAVQKPVVRGGQLAVGHEMIGTMSSDHRVIDGALAALYLQALKHAIEQPAALLV